MYEFVQKYIPCMQKCVSNKLQALFVSDSLDEIYLYFI